jgi:hypothetical protein
LGTLKDMYRKALDNVISHHRGTVGKPRGGVRLKGSHTVKEGSVNGACFAMGVALPPGGELGGRATLLETLKTR